MSEEVSVRIQIFDDEVLRDLPVPSGRVTLRRMLPVFREISETILDYCATNVGKPIRCERGCAHCCHHLVPLSQTEALSIAELVKALPEPRRAEILARFDALKARLVDADLYAKLLGPLDLTATGETYLSLGLACPFLEAGECSIYEERPIACREYLVTSDPARCADPMNERVATVPLPGHVWENLVKLERAKNAIPLAICLEWSRTHKDPPPKSAEAHLRAFFEAGG